jgi:hypothetical protein
MVKPQLAIERMVGQGTGEAGRRHDLASAGKAQALPIPERTDIGEFFVDQETLRGTRRRRSLCQTERRRCRRPMQGASARDRSPDRIGLSQTKTACLSHRPLPGGMGPTFVWTHDRRPGHPHKRGLDQSQRHIPVQQAENLPLQQIPFWTGQSSPLTRADAQKRPPRVHPGRWGIFTHLQHLGR